MSSPDQISGIAAKLGELDAESLALVERIVSGLDYRRRYGNPPHLLGFPMCDSDGEGARALLTVTDVHLNPHGIAHGMVPFGMLDNAMGQVATAANERLRPCVSVEVSIRFSKAMPPGDYEVTARPLHAGRRFALVEGQIRGPGGLYVHANATYAYLDEVAGGRALPTEERPWVSRT